MAKCVITIWNREFDITDLWLAAQPNQLTLCFSDICRIGDVPVDRTIERRRGKLLIGAMNSCDVLDGDVFDATPRAYA